jgi:hypothetical protein
MLQAAPTQAPARASPQPAEQQSQRARQGQKGAPAQAPVQAMAAAWQHSPRQLAQRQQMLQTFGSVPLQRLVVPVTGTNGLLANLDTANFGVARQQVDTLWLGGRVDALAELMFSLQPAPGDLHPANTRQLRAHITELLSRRAASDPNAGNASWLTQKAFDLLNRPQDETGIVQPPGQAPQAPANPTALQTAAIGVRSWQVGDLTDSISWSTLGNHMQGRISAAKYIQLGHDLQGLHDLKNGTNLQGTLSDLQKTQLAQNALARVEGEVRGGVNGLPQREGVSYRAATSAPGVFGGAIQVGDLIKDMAFWSTAALPMPHLGIDFCSEGTTGTPKAYFIVTGSSGVFLPRFTNTEVGVREVLYPDQTIFRVTQITNYAKRTYFVHVTEQDPATLGLNPATKNPWSGANNP